MLCTFPIRTVDRRAVQEGLTMKCIRLAWAVVLILVAGAEARAQDATDAREAIERKTHAGDRLTIDTRQGLTLQGRLVSQAADALVS
jgi:hypothetical protein